MTPPWLLRDKKRDVLRMVAAGSRGQQGSVAPRLALSWANHQGVNAEG